MLLSKFVRLVCVILGIAVATPSVLADGTVTITSPAYGSDQIFYYPIRLSGSMSSSVYAYNVSYGCMDQATNQYVTLNREGLYVGTSPTFNNYSMSYSEYSSNSRN